MHPQENNNQVPQRKTNVLNWLRTFQQNELLQKRELKAENDTCGWIILLGVLKYFHHLEICFWAFYLKQEVALSFPCLYHTNTLRYCKWACTWQLIHSALGNAWHLKMSTLRTSKSWLQVRFIVSDQVSGDSVLKCKRNYVEKNSPHASISFSLFWV